MYATNALVLTTLKQANGKCPAHCRDSNSSRTCLPQLGVLVGVGG